jgi:hypothetical protein
VDGEFGGMDVIWGCGGAADDVTRFRLPWGSWWLDGWADVGERDVRTNRRRKLRVKPGPEDSELSHTKPN